MHILEIKHFLMNLEECLLSGTHSWNSLINASYDFLVSDDALTSDFVVPYSKLIFEVKHVLVALLHFKILLNIYFKLFYS